MNRILLLLSLFAQSVFAQTTDCANIDFENGNFDNWEVSGNVTVVNKDQLDPYGLFPLALSGYYGLKLGNNQMPALSSVSRTLTITNDNKFFIYGFAIVLLGYPHTPDVASYVSLEVTDQNDNPIPCASYSVYAESTVGNGFTQSASPDEPNLGTECCFPIFYKPWELTALDLTPYIGQTLNFKILSDWCLYQVDWGYAYVDAYCSNNLVKEYQSCSDEQINLGAVPGFESYTWTGPGITSGQGTNEIQINSPGLYTLNIPNPNPSCDSLFFEYNATNDVLPDRPLAEFEFNIDCEDSIVEFTNVSSSETYINSITWTFGDGDTSNLFSPDHTYNSVGSYTVSLIVENESECSDTIMHTISLLEPPVLELGPDLYLCDGASIEIIPSAFGGDTYNWSNGATTSSVTVNSPQTLVLKYSYHLCEVSDTIDVLDNGANFNHIPNVITANADGINDLFILSSDSLVEFEIVILNRWGEKVFESKDPLIHWDGTHKNEKVDDGVYFYYIDYRLSCQTELHNKHGNVTVVR